jgi:hypothetical protein
LEPLTFSFAEISSSEYVELYPVPASLVSDEMWQELVNDVAAERGLIPHPSSVLARRWQGGYAAVAVKDGRVASYISLIPIFSAANRSKLAALLDIESARLPATDVYEFATAWTHGAWRRKRVSLQLRPALLARFNAPGWLGASGMAGLSSPVLAKLGWRILGWNAVPFTSSLIGIPLVGFEDCAALGWRPPPGLERYEGPHVPLDDTAHPWERYCYLWVSDVLLATEFNHQLVRATDGNLRRWREAVIAVSTGPESLHRLAFLD